jgi:GntR family histidine utilization transcriptional repressor
MSPAMSPTMSDPRPESLRSQITEHVISQIVKGIWQAQDRIPSESQLMEQFGVSRMTVHHALRQLTAQGFLTRRSGAGTYVAPPRPYVAEYAHRDVIAEVRERGGTYQSRVIKREIAPASADQAELFGCAPGKPLLHVIIVHLENGAPLELEDRLVDPEALPDCLTIDLSQETIFSRLMLMRPYREGRESIRATLPDADQQAWLGVAAGTPCLETFRQTWSDAGSVTAARLLRAGDKAMREGVVKPIYAAPV